MTTWDFWNYTNYKDGTRIIATNIIHIEHHRHQSQ